MVSIHHFACEQFKIVEFFNSFLSTNARCCTKHRKDCSTRVPEELFKTSAENVEKTAFLTDKCVGYMQARDTLLVPFFYSFYP